MLKFAALLFFVPALALAEEPSRPPSMPQTPPPADAQMSMVVSMLAQQLAQAQTKMHQMEAELDALKAAAK